MNVLSSVRAELRASLMSTLEKRYDSRDHVMANKEQLAKVAHQAYSHGHKWAIHRNRNPILAPGQSFWVDLQEELSAKIDRLIHSVYFWRSLLYFMVQGGLPGMPRSLELLEFIRKFSWRLEL